jgi:FAD/FMN-containing dehydrogenase
VRRGDAEEAGAGVNEAPVAVGGVVTARVERPADRRELDELLAATTGPVVPLGGGRWNGITGPLVIPEGAEPLAIDASRLDHVLDFEPDDLTITVEAGMRMNALTLKLAGAGLCVPLASGSFELSVGTVLAEARRAAQAAGYDGPRRHLLGLTVIDGAGIERRAGGRVVKNVSGYDLMKLHTGARETLGLPTIVTLRLTPLPELRRTLAFTLPGVEAIDALTRALVHSDARPASYTIRRGEAGLTGRLEFDGFDEDTALELELALAMIASVGGSPGESSELAGRDAGRRLFESLHDDGPDWLDLALPGFDAGRAMSLVERHAPSGRVRFDPLLAAGSLAFRFDAEDVDLEALARMRTDLARHDIRTRLVSCRGGDDQPAPLVLDPALVDGAAPPELTLMRRIKAALDPDRRFSPGLHLWGL